MKRNDKAVGLQDLVEGFLFSLQAEGRSSLTHKYYDGSLRHFLWLAKEQSWPDRIDLLDTRHIRQFLAWVGSRHFEYAAGNGSRKYVKAKPSTAWRYYRAMRRLFNFAVGEGLLEKSPVKDIHFKPPPLTPIQPYSIEELKRFLAICELDIRTGAPFIGLRNKAILLLFVDTALRASELAQLELLWHSFSRKHYLNLPWFAIGTSTLSYVFYDLSHLRKCSQHINQVYRFTHENHD